MADGTTGIEGSKALVGATGLHEPIVGIRSNYLRQLGIAGARGFMADYQRERRIAARREQLLRSGIVQQVARVTVEQEVTAIELPDITEAAVPETAQELVEAELVNSVTAMARES